MSASHWLGVVGELTFCWGEKSEVNLGLQIAKNQEQMQAWVCRSPIYQGG